MGIPPIISDLALIMIVAGISTVVFKWLKQPIILGYIVAGFLVSKQFVFTPAVSGNDDVEVWAKIGVVFLLFALGLEFSFRKVAKVGKSALSASAIIIPGMILVGLAVGTLLGWTTSNSAMLGCMICMSSTTIILKALDDLDLRSHRFASVVLGVLIFEDLAAVLIMVLLPTIAAGQSFEGSELFFVILRLVFFLIIWLVVGIFFIPSILKRTKNFLNDETLLIVSVGLCLGMVYFASVVGFSEEFGAFVMGSILAETIEAERITKVMTPIKDFFGAVFFVSVGMMIEPSILVEYWKEILVISMAVIIGQVCLGTMGVLFSGATLRSAIQCGFSLTQVGEFAFIVALLGTQLKLCDEFLYPVIVAVSVVTIFITPFMMKSAIPVVEWLNVKLPEKYRSIIERTQTKKEVEGVMAVWKSFLTQILEIVCIYGAVSMAIVLIFVTYIFPKVSELPGGLWINIVLTIVSILLVSPFIRAIMAKKNHSAEYKYLFAVNRSNWAPLVGLTLLRVVVGVVIVASLIRHGVLLDYPWISTFISVALLFLIFHSRAIKYWSIKIERKFFYNLNIREIEMRKNMAKKTSAFESEVISKSLSTHDLHLADFVVDANAECCDKTLIELNLRQVCGVHVVSIIRGELRINIPGGKEKILPYDKVLVLGTDDQLTAVGKIFGKPEFDANTMQKKEVSVEQLIIEEGSPLEGKTIVESGIRDKAKCLVVGIEHEGETTMSPSIHTKFCVGDVVWIVGEKDRIQNLIQSTLTSIDFK